jgi:DNA-binding transcriptional regulator GbsR (MarR family)
MSAFGPAAKKFVLHWGEMGTRWGINRTVAQVHALLYLSEKPLHAEEICEALDLARSNVSVALKELQGWGIVKLVHLPGDRRDHFESLHDVFEMFRIIALERKRREIDPTLRIIHECIAEADKPKAADAHVRERLEEMRQFFELAETSANQLQKIPTSALVKLAKMGDKALRLLGLAGS